MKKIGTQTSQRNNDIITQAFKSSEPTLKVTRDTDAKVSEDDTFPKVPETEDTTPNDGGGMGGHEIIRVM